MMYKILTYDCMTCYGKQNFKFVPFGVLEILGLKMNKKKMKNEKKKKKEEMKG